jgi:hypothetical protein
MNEQVNPVSGEAVPTNEENNALAKTLIERSLDGQFRPTPSHVVGCTRVVLPGRARPCVSSDEISMLLDMADDTFLEASVRNAAEETLLRYFKQSLDQIDINLARAAASTSRRVSCEVRGAASACVRAWARSVRDKMDVCAGSTQTTHPTGMDKHPGDIPGE